MTVGVTGCGFKYDVTWQARLVVDGPAKSADGTRATSRAGVISSRERGASVSLAIGSRLVDI